MSLTSACTLRQLFLLIGLSVTASAVLAKRGELDGPGLKACQALFEQEPNPKRNFMQLHLDPDARAGQADDINQVLTIIYLFTSTYSNLPNSKRYTGLFVTLFDYLDPPPEKNNFCFRCVSLVL